MEQMLTVAQLSHLVPPFDALQADAAILLAAASGVVLFRRPGILDFAPAEEFLALDDGDPVLDCGGDDSDRDRDEGGGGAVEYDDVIVGAGGGVRRFLRRRLLVEAEAREGADEEVVGVRDYVEEEGYGDDFGHCDCVEEETHFDRFFRRRAAAAAEEEEGVSR